MLGDYDVTASIAVKDIKEARDFYTKTLGLKELKEVVGMGVMYQSGNGRMFVYQAPTAGTAKSTLANWEVDNIAKVVDGLKAKGIAFEHYEFPGTTHEGDVHVMGGMKSAWFKDPSGNILGLGEK